MTTEDINYYKDHKIESLTKCIDNCKSVNNFYFAEQIKKMKNWLSSLNECQYLKII